MAHRKNLTSLEVKTAKDYEEAFAFYIDELKKLEIHFKDADQALAKSINEILKAFFDIRNRTYEERVGRIEDFGELKMDGGYKPTIYKSIDIKPKSDLHAQTYNLVDKIHKTTALFEHKYPEDKFVATKPSLFYRLAVLLGFIEKIPESQKPEIVPPGNAAIVMKDFARNLQAALSANGPEKMAKVLPTPPQPKPTEEYDEKFILSYLHTFKSKLEKVEDNKTGQGTVQSIRKEFLDKQMPYFSRLTDKGRLQINAIIDKINRIHLPTDKSSLLEAIETEITARSSRKFTRSS